MKRRGRPMRASQEAQLSDMVPNRLPRSAVTGHLPQISRRMRSRPRRASAKVLASSVAKSAIFTPSRAEGALCNTRRASLNGRTETRVQDRIIAAASGCWRLQYRRQARIQTFTKGCHRAAGNNMVTAHGGGVECVSINRDNEAFTFTRSIQCGKSRIESQIKYKASKEPWPRTVRSQSKVRDF